MARIRFRKPADRFRKPAMSPELSQGFTHIILYNEAHYSVSDHNGEMSIEYEMPIRIYSIPISVTSLIKIYYGKHVFYIVIVQPFKNMH